MSSIYAIYLQLLK